MSRSFGESQKIQNFFILSSDAAFFAAKCRIKIAIRAKLTFKKIKTKWNRREKWIGIGVRKVERNIWDQIKIKEFKY